MTPHWLARLPAVAVMLGSLSGAAFAQGDTCANRGQLDDLYCDENNDLVADVPKDRRSGAIPRPSCSPTRRSRTPRSIRISSSRSPTTSRNAPANGSSTIRYNRTRPRSRRCDRAACTSPASRPDPPGLPLISRARCRSPPRAPKRARTAITFSPREEGQPVPEARRSQGQACRPHLACIELRQPRPARAVPARGVETGRRLQAADVGRA